MSDFKFNALFQIVAKDSSEGILDSSVYDGDTIFGKRKPDPQITIASDSNTRDDGLEKDGDYYRLKGVDTHELNSSSDVKRDMAIEERDAVRAWVREGIEEWDGEWPFTVDVYSEGSFGRMLVDLYRRSDSSSLVEWLKEEFDDRDITYE